MTSRRDELVLDDRALDDDIERLRASTEHYIDTVRAWVRRTLADGEHPEDAMVRAAECINYWLQARGVPFYTPLQETTNTITGFVLRAQQLMSAEETVYWFVTPARELRGRSPVDALVRHRFYELEVFMRKLEDAKRNAEADAEPDEGAEEPDLPEPGHHGRRSTDDEEGDAR